MSLYYRVLYRLGIRPWEEDPTRGPAADQISRLLGREEEDRRPPYGPALDLGCGTGIWSVHLSERGWDVTGVDIVPRAIREARERAARIGVSPRFLAGDVTELRAAGVESGFRFVLDFECFNHLKGVQREAVARDVTAVTVPGATMLMLVWSPGRRWPLPPGAAWRDIEAAFVRWRVVDEESYAATTALPWWLRRTDLRFYRLRRD